MNGLTPYTIKAASVIVHNQEASSKMKLLNLLCIFKVTIQGCDSGILCHVFNAHWVISIFFCLVGVAGEGCHKSLRFISRLPTRRGLRGITQLPVVYHIFDHKVEVSSQQRPRKCFQTLKKMMMWRLKGGRKYTILKSGGEVLVDVLDNYKQEHYFGYLKLVT